MSSKAIPRKTLKGKQQFFNHLRLLKGNKTKNTGTKSTISCEHQCQSHRANNLGGGQGERGGRAGQARTRCRWAGDMDRGEQGLLRTDPVPEEGDVAATISATETLSEEERE
eukprot:bmy_03999T0